MKLIIEGTSDEIKNTLKAISGSNERADEFSNSIFELQQKTIEKLSEAMSIYQSFLDRSKQ